MRSQIARTYFYVHDRYDLNMSKQQHRLFIAWDKQHPVTLWERQRDQRIPAVMGHTTLSLPGREAGRLVTKTVQRAWCHGWTLGESKYSQTSIQQKSGETETAWSTTFRRAALVMTECYRRIEFPFPLRQKLALMAIAKPETVDNIVRATEE